MTSAVKKPYVLKICEGFLRATFTTIQDEAVHAIFLCFLEAAQIANLKIAFLNAGFLNAFGFLS